MVLKKTVFLLPELLCLLIVLFLVPPTCWKEEHYHASLVSASPMSRRGACC